MSFLIVPFGALLTLALFQLVSVVLRNRRYAAQAKELGCQDAPMYPSGFFGLKMVKQLMAADEKKLFPEMLIEREEHMHRTTGRECSTFKFVTLGSTIYFTSDPENIKAMLATQFQDYDLGPARRGNMIRTLGDGIFVQDSKQWEHSRALLRPQFARDQISDLEQLEAHTQHLFKAIGAPSSDGWTSEVPLQTLFFRLTLDSATEFLFGESVDSQIKEMPGNISKKLDREVDFAKNFDEAQMHMAKSFRMGDLYWLNNPKSFKENNVLINQFVDHYVQLALKFKQKGSEKVMEDGHKKDKYVFLEAIAQETSDPYELRSQLLNILLAGRDTTASLLSWHFHLLLRNPEAFDKLRKVIIETFGTYEEPKEISFSTLKGCQLLQAHLSETNRLWTIVPLNGRRTNKPTTLPRGGGPDGKSKIFLPPQTDVHYGIHVTHRRKAIWGEDADEFKPERFIGRKSGWEYVPFNGGPRICIGQQFALTEASYVLVRLLQKFDKISARPEELEGPTLSNLTLTSCPGRPVTLRLHAAA